MLKDDAHAQAKHRLPKLQRDNFGMESKERHAD